MNDQEIKEVMDLIDHSIRLVTTMEDVSIGEAIDSLYSAKVLLEYQLDSRLADLEFLEKEDFYGPGD